MASISRSRYFRGFLTLLFIGAALFLGWLAVSMVVEAITGQGSSGGSLVLISVGLLLLVFSTIVFVVGIIILRQLQPNTA